MTTKCAKFDFYEVEIDLCDQHSVETFQAEKDSIENTVDDLRNTLVKLKKQNSALREQLQSLTSTLRTSSPTVLQSPEVEIGKILSRSEIYIPQ